MENMKIDNLVAKLLKMPFTTNEKYVKVLFQIKKLYGCDYSALNMAFNFGYAIARMEWKNNEQKNKRKWNI